MVTFDEVINYISYFSIKKWFLTKWVIPRYIIWHLVDTVNHWIISQIKASHRNSSVCFPNFSLLFLKWDLPQKSWKSLFLSVLLCYLLFSLYLSIKFVVEFGLCLALGFLFTIILIKFRITFFFNFPTLVWENNT